MRRHRVELGSENLGVAVRLVQRPRYPDTSVAPDRCRLGVAKIAGVRQVLQYVGNDETDDAVVVLLLEVEVTQPAAEKRVDIEKIGGGRGERGDVTGPAETLISLRAVGRDIHEIAAHTPHDILVELVQQ